MKNPTERLGFYTLFRLFRTGFASFRDYAHDTKLLFWKQKRDKYVEIIHGSTVVGMTKKTAKICGK